MRIAFAGPRGVGKTTLAEHLVQRHGFTRRSLAEPIKKIIAECLRDSHDRFGFLMRWAERLWPNGSLTTQAKFATQASRLFATETDPGKLAQKLGTDIGRALDPDVWVRYFLRRLPPGNVVCDDVRFANEVRELHRVGFMLIRLQAPQEILAERIARRGDDHRDPHHDSEHALPESGYDYEWDTSEPLATTIARLNYLVERLARQAG